MDKPLAKPRGLSVRAAILIGIVAVLAIGILLGIPSLRRWANADRVLSASSVRMARAQIGELVRDAPAQGRILAALHPTLFAPATGIVQLEVRAGVSVKKGDALVHIQSPELLSRLAQETARLEGLRSAVGRQALSAKQTVLKDEQAVSLLAVRLSAAQRLLQRAENMFNLGLLTSIDLAKAKDDVQLAELELAHARDNLKVERDIAEFDLKDKNLEAARQASVEAELRR